MLLLFMVKVSHSWIILYCIIFFIIGTIIFCERNLVKQSTTLRNTYCVIPNNQGSIYSNNVSNKMVGLSPGDVVDRFTVVEENCEEEYHKVVHYNVWMCLDNGWKSTYSGKLCLKKCQPLTSDSLDFKCTLHGDNVNCSELSTPGTTVTPSCKDTHHIPNGGDEIPVKLECLPDGEWRGNLYTCIPNCGRPYTPHKLMILNGTKAKYGTAPWNVGVYQKNHITYELICGGSLISNNLVVSSAHCFDDGSSINKTLLDDSLKYKISVGKFDRNISLKDNEFTQIVDVRIIYLHEHYYGSSGNHQNDIAVVVLSEKVRFSDVVMPICMDWSTKYTVNNGDLGKVVGWGYTETKQLSEFLLEAKLLFIDHYTCRALYQGNEFQKFVTGDKFCARSESGQGVDLGDSGGGLTFPGSSNGLHYLTGLVSVKSDNSTDPIAVFTALKSHIKFIEKHFTNEIPNEDGNKTKENKKSCRPLTSDSLNIICTLDGKLVDLPSTPGTKLESFCKDTFITPKSGYESPMKLRCLTNGEWSDNLYTCEPISMRRATQHFLSSDEQTNHQTDHPFNNYNCRADF